MCITITSNEMVAIATLSGWNVVCIRRYSNVNFDVKIKLQAMHDFVELISISSAGACLEKVVGGLRGSAAA